MGLIRLVAIPSSELALGCGDTEFHVLKCFVVDVYAGLFFASKRKKMVDSYSLIVYRSALLFDLIHVYARTLPGSHGSRCGAHSTHHRDGALSLKYLSLELDLEREHERYILAVASV